MASEELVLLVEDVSVSANELKDSSVVELLYAGTGAFLPTEMAPLHLEITLCYSAARCKKARVWPEATKVEQCDYIQIDLLLHHMKELEPDEVLK